MLPPASRTPSLPRARNLGVDAHPLALESIRAMVPATLASLYRGITGAAVRGMEAPAIPKDRAMAFSLVI